MPWPSCPMGAGEPDPGRSEPARLSHKGPAVPGPAPQHPGDPHPHPGAACPQRGAWPPPRGAAPTLSTNPGNCRSRSPACCWGGFGPGVPCPGSPRAPRKQQDCATAAACSSPRLFLALDAARSRRPGNRVPGTARPQTALSGSATAGRQVQLAAPPARGTGPLGTRRPGLAWVDPAGRRPRDAPGHRDLVAPCPWPRQAPGSWDQARPGWDLVYLGGAKPP